MKILSTILIGVLAVSMVTSYPDTYLRTLLDALDQIVDSDATSKKTNERAPDAYAMKRGEYDWSGTKTLCGSTLQTFKGNICGRKREAKDALAFLETDDRQTDPILLALALTSTTLNEECCGEACYREEIAETC
ncbi:uncharacterized protein [Amphiura filiformis]|uniref:uncharacterized protein isoform X1 n=1 Tax=Amphiura filiformis TaxID=82378 RepID=UPI003B20EA24